MTPERYQRICEIVDAALDLSPEERPAFLDRACGGESGTMREEVEKLLARESRIGDFLKGRAIEALAADLIEDRRRLAPGSQLSHFRIEALIGMGGMGEVYLAWDRQLDRRVALKLLPLEFISNQDLVRRFEQEARAASALNHPNIVTVYEMDETDGLRFIATEFIDGRTLREMIAEGPIEPARAVEIATQIAVALDAAHHAGIVHRDIKPENVMVRPDGLVKVLDFGLAHMAEAMPSHLPSTMTGMTGLTGLTGLGGEADTRKTRVMGTVNYMSPEHASGSPVDGRTDIYSLGVVLHELLTGRLPNAGGHPIPADLARIVIKAISPDRGHRYQNAGEMLDDLRRRQEPRSIAVLPFQVFSPDPSDNYLGFGMASEIVTRISRIDELAVRPASAVKRYAGAGIESLAAGREQQVDLVIEGSMQRGAGEWRVDVSLLQVGDGASLWADSFRLGETEIFRMQHEVVRQVAARLRLDIGSQQLLRLNRPTTLNAAAMNCYLRGTNHFSDRDPNLIDRAPCDQAIAELSKAVELDPDFAEAHAKLGYVMGYRAIWYGPDEPMIARAMEALDRAESLNPQLAEVPLARGMIKWSQYDGFQVEAAIEEIRRARRLDPHIAHFELAELYAHLGLEEWVEEMEQAIRLDPANDFLRSNRFRFYLFHGQLDEAVRTNLNLANHPFDDVFWHLEMMEAAPIASLVEDWRRNYPENGFFAQFKAVVDALQGRLDEALAAVPEILLKCRLNPAHHHSTHAIARIHALAGRRHEALHWLRTTVAEGFPNYPTFLHDPYFAGMRDEPEFRQFLAELKTRWENAKDARNRDSLRPLR